MQDNPNPGSDPQPVEGDIPAFVQPTSEEEATREKEYVVTGVHAVLDHAPGEVFRATLTRDQERNFIEYGHLAYTQAQDQPTSQGETQAPVESEQTQTSAISDEE